MSPAEFDSILEERLRKIKEVLSLKAKEYSKNSDRLHNFKVAARINGTAPERECWNFMTKHIVCVLDMVEGRTEVTDKMIDEKIGDVINYCILLEALFREKLGGEMDG